MPTDRSTKTNRKTKSPRALVPGVTLFRKTIRVTDDDRDTNVVVRGSAQVGGTQQVRERSVAYHGLESAIEQVCQWRYDHVPDTGYESADAMVEEALDAAVHRLSVMDDLSAAEARAWERATTEAIRDQGEGE